jgi:hypothetical protein
MTNILKIKRKEIKNKISKFIKKINFLNLMIKINKKIILMKYHKIKNNKTKTIKIN